ncbi:UNVERIFIED_CONTAM: hypothetical protein RMT77_016323 [Armadillidium vulgare]
MHSPIIPLLAIYLTFFPYKVNGENDSERYADILNRRFHTSISNYFQLCNFKSYEEVNRTFSTSTNVIIDKTDKIEEMMNGIPNCITEVLVIRNNDVLASSIINFCHNLKYIYFDADNFDCKDGRWLQFIIEAKQKKINLYSKETSEGQPTCKEFTSSSCANATSAFLLHIACSDAFDFCKDLKRCQCSVNLDYLVSVNCSNASLKNDDLPSRIPILTRDLYFQNNQLTDIKNWCLKVLGERKLLSRINFSNNKILSLPFLPESENKLDHIFLQNNSIIKLETEILKSFLPYKDLALSIAGNPFQCDCETPFYLEFLSHHTKKLDDFKFIICTNNKTGEIGRPWVFDYEHCKGKMSWKTVYKEISSYYCIMILSILNILMIGLFIDVNRALTDLHFGNNKRIPWLHPIVENLKAFALYMFPCVKNYVNIEIHFKNKK